MRFLFNFNYTLRCLSYFEAFLENFTGKVIKNKLHNKLTLRPVGLHTSLKRKLAIIKECCAYLWQEAKTIEGLESLSFKSLVSRIGLGVCLLKLIYQLTCDLLAFFELAKE